MHLQYSTWPVGHFNAYWDNEASGTDKSNQVLRVDRNITDGYSLTYKYIVNNGVYAVVNQIVSDGNWSTVHQDLHDIILEFVQDVDDAYPKTGTYAQVGRVTLAFLYVVAFTTAFIIALITGAAAFCRYIKRKRHEHSA